MFLGLRLFCAWIFISHAVAVEEAHTKVCHSKITEDGQRRYYAIVQKFEASAPPSAWKCLVASENGFLSVENCNFSDKKQIWNRKQNQGISNEHTAECLDRQSGQIFLQECNDSSPTQKWKCGRTRECTNNLVSSSDEDYHIVINDINISSTTDPNLCTKWRFVKLNETRFYEDEDAQFCKQDRKPCRPPPAGLDSFLVSPSTAASIIHDAGLFINHEGNIVGRKSCYDPDDTVVISCNPGYETLEDQSPYRILSCIDGYWSDTRPVYCVRKYCDQPPNEKFAKPIASTTSSRRRRSPESAVKPPSLERYREKQAEDKASTGANFRFGDVVRYVCLFGYKGTPTTRLCGTSGKWVGRKPHCTPGCEYNITAESGLIRSPRYPGPYNHLQQCKWDIEVPEGLRIVFWVRDFYVEPSSILTTTCHHDVFYVTEGNKTLDYCGSTGPHGWISKGNNVTIGFSTDHSQAFKGFKIEFTSWNSSETSEPIEPIRNGTYPDEEIRSHVHIATEYARYYLEAIYVFLAFLGLGCIGTIIFYHIYDWGRVHPIVDSALNVASRLYHDGGIHNENMPTEELDMLSPIEDDGDEAESSDNQDETNDIPIIVIQSEE